MKLVRRARKSIRERRMKACVNDLNNNLAKVERQLYKKQKSAREKTRKSRGALFSIPAEVRQGRMTPELYAIECRLHSEAGLPRPAPYIGYAQDVQRQRHGRHRIGFVEFAALVAAIRRVNSTTSISA